jgi:16S rRNA (adenine1518-N6/adenine1519-N6)-dimethyltransferase
MNLSEIKQLLKKHDLQLTKSMGQNFMHDSNQLERLVALASLSDQDKVLEIGPGLGPLTERLLEQSGHVLAIETDRRLVKVLQERWADMSKLELLHADALRYLKDKTVAGDDDWSDWKMVANLPYSVASPIIAEMALNPRGVQQMIVTLQWEVAERLCASPGGKDFGILTLLAQLGYEPREKFKIPPKCFFPVPDVDSAGLRLERRPQPLLEPGLIKAFTRIVKRSFSQRRKMMMKLLKADWPLETLKMIFEELEISPLIRAEKVSLETFVELTKRLNEDGCKPGNI